MSEPLRLARGFVKEEKSSERRKISAGTLVNIHVGDQVALLLKCVVSRDEIEPQEAAAENAAPFV